MMSFIIDYSHDYFLSLLISPLIVRKKVKMPSIILSYTEN